MPTIFKRSNGIYYILFRENGKVRWVSTGKRHRSLALEFLMSRETDKTNAVKEKEQEKNDSSCMKLSQFIGEFQTYAETSYSVKSQQMYRSILEKALTVFGDVELSSISSRDVDRFKADRLKKVSPVSVNVELRTLRAAFYTALRWKIVVENPFKQVPMARVPDEQPEYLTKEQFHGLLAVTKEEWLRDIIILAVSTGMRRGELLNLRWEDIRFEDRLIRVQSNGDFRTKSGKRRWIPMNSTAYGVAFKRAKEKNGDYMFSLEGRALSAELVTHKFKKAAREIGLNPKIHFHSLRHTFATWLVREGVSIFEIQKLLGHASIKVTQIYSHLESAQLRTTVDKISLSEGEVDGDHVGISLITETS